MKISLLRVIVPVLLVILGAIGMGTYYVQGNTPAVSGYFSATLGWLIVAGFNAVEYIKEREYLV